MNLTEARRHMSSLMVQHGLSDWHFAWDRSVSRRGQCNYSRRTITMSRPLTELASFEEAEQTMLHEIAHAMVGSGHGHDNVWLRQGRAIGFKGTRTSKRENEVPKPFVAICKGCGMEYGRHRRPKAGAACGRCCRNGYNAEYALVFTRRVNH